MKAGQRSILLHYAQGLLMGGADVIPGVSGGTVALIVGIYERLISSIRAFATASIALVRGDVVRARADYAEVHWALVLPLAAGILTALVIGARYIPALLDAYPVETRALFFGLIIGSLPIPWRRIDRPSGGNFGIAVVAAIAAYMLVGLPPQEVQTPALPVVFLSAAVAICAMILPGISGSFLLLVMGMYEPTLRALDSRQLDYVAAFAAGAAIGLGVFSKLLEYLLERHHDITMAALVGLMAGSLRAIWPYLDADRTLLPPPADPSVLGVLALALIGFGAVTLLGRFGAAVDSRIEREK